MTRSPWLLASPRASSWARRLYFVASPSAAGEPRQQHRHHAGDEYAVESAGAADRKNGRPEALKLVEIEQIGADQHAKAAAGIGQRRGVAPGDDHGDDGRGHRRDEDRQADADAADRLREGMADRGDDAVAIRPRTQSRFFGNR